MKLLYISNEGGTCDRCGKGLVNVAHIEGDDKVVKTIGLDCAIQVIMLGKDIEKRVIEFEDSPTKDVKLAMQDAKELAKIRTAINKGRFEVKVEFGSEGDKVYYWKDNKYKYSWHWVGIERQNTKNLRKVIWDLVAKT